MKSDNLSLKKKLKQFKEKLGENFNPKTNIHATIRKLVLFTDALLIDLFNKNGLNQKKNFCLLALGSYGRRELLLYSDVDLLLLHTDNLSKDQLQQAQKFIQDCWDVGLNISHQTTTISSCVQLASQNIAVMSSLIDMFLLCGCSNLMEELRYQIHPLHLWSSLDFFKAKREEQRRRDIKYGETAYNLEPNVKYGPGGLRDSQTLLSIGKRHFQIKKMADGIKQGFLSEKEYESFTYCQNFLWRIRFALHYLAGKAEERLSFDYQTRLAQFFGYHDNPHSLAIEQFMKNYFKVIKKNRELNEILLQWFDETIAQPAKQQLTSLDNDFQLSSHYIEVRHPRIFQHKPQTLLKLFWWIAINPEIKGIRASTIRLIRESLYLVNDRFKLSSSVTHLFMKILQTENNPYKALQLMSRYGVLAQYLDAFALITGQMQYDLFHAYTVDQHTLFVIRNLARFKESKYKAQFALCSEIMPRIVKPEILYLSALFHDIAKGRGGDHSELGALEAQSFAKKHQLSKAEEHLLIWLVRHHLLMSQTAQRQDIYDPNVIKEFCSLLPKPFYLDYLYLLTVADICGTNPNLWNTWKDSLLKELYFATRQMLDKEQALNNKVVYVAKRKGDALRLLQAEGFSSSTIQAIWQQFKDKYFLHEPPEVIACHTKAIINCNKFPLILIMPHHGGGGTELFIYMPHQDNRFVITTSVLSNHHMTIQEARISTSPNGFDIDIYIILDDQERVVFEPRDLETIQKALHTHLAKNNQIPVLSQRRTRLLDHFKVTTKIHYEDDLINNQTRLFLVTTDKPGLLALISHVFLNSKIHLHNAKIVTAGERAEDMFYITNQNNQLLTDKERENLKTQLLRALS